MPSVTCDEHEVRFMQSGNTLNAESIRSVLPEELIRWKVVYHAATDSTQNRALELFRRDGQGGILIITDAQTAGRGRLSNRWIAPIGDALTFSLILLSGHAPGHLPLITFAVALSVCDAMRRMLGLDPDVKWPNDVLLSGRKVCGILTETVRDAAGNHGVVVGIGVNVNQRRSAFLGDLKDTATSLFIELGHGVDRLSLLGEIMRSFEENYFLYQKGEVQEIIRRWKNYSSMLGRRVSLMTTEGEISGSVLDLEDSGALVLRLDTGHTRSFFGSHCRYL